MVVAHFFDYFSLGTLFLLTVTLLIGTIEIGFRIGVRMQGKSVKAQASQVRAIMGATLGLLAFMMAFTFATAQKHYETRVAHMVEETRLVSNAFLFAGFLEEPTRSTARSTLRQFLDDRLTLSEYFDAGRIEEGFKLIDRAEQLHLELWNLAAVNEPGDAGVLKELTGNGQFIAAVVGLIDMQAQRLQAALANRIPVVIWLTLYFTGILSMLVMGYQAGLVSKRSPVATMTLAVAFSSVLMLITDLDRPIQSMFEMDNQVVKSAIHTMDIIIQAEGKTD